MDGRATVRDVAAAAGVSVATVSRALNGLQGVSPERAEAVRLQAQRLGYRPNHLGRGLRSGRTGLAGLVIPDLANPSFEYLVRSITAAADADDYGIVVVDTYEDPEREIALSERLMLQTVGLILSSPRMPEDDLLKVSQADKPVLCVNRDPASAGIPRVTIDEHHAGRLLATHLLELGHRRIAYLEGPEHSWSNTERLRALHEAEPDGLLVSVLTGGVSMEAGYAAGEAVLASGATCAVTFNDFAAWGLLARLNHLGAEVPHDISVAGFDDLSFSRFTTPALTTVTRPVAELGQSAWTQFKMRLDHAPVPPPPVLRGELRPRDSVRPNPR